MAESSREQALVKIAAALATMTGTRFWGGSYANAPTVERILKTPQQVLQHPWLGVIEASGSTLEIGSVVGAQAMYAHGFKVTVYGYIKGDNVVTRSTWLQRLWDDVKRTLLADATLGGVARDLTLDGDFDTDEGQLGDVGAFAQDLTVTLDEVVTVG